MGGSEFEFVKYLHRADVQQLWGWAYADEVKAYCETIPKLIELEKTYCNGESQVAKIMPKFYAGGADKETRGFFLIMEDLSDNYVMVNKKIYFVR